MHLNVKEMINYRMAGYLCSTVIILAFATPALLVDPCAQYSKLPNEGYRYKYYTLDASKTFQDTYLREGWYKSCVPMLNHSPDGIYFCGTKFPIWLPGAHPNTTERVDMSTCLTDLLDNCSKRFDIQIAKCSDGCYRYNLGPTVTSSGYCFGVGVEGDPPQYVISKPVVKVDLGRTETKGGYAVTTTRFTCVFTESSNENLLYIVHWYMNGRLQYTTPWAENHTNSTLLLTEDVFLAEGFKLGIELACSVTSFEVENGQPGKRSPISDSLFAGIKILEHNLVLSSTNTATIQLEPTIPIGCMDADNPCTIRVIAYLKDTDVVGECKPIAFNTECGKTISSDSWNEQFNITIEANLGQINDESYNTYIVNIKVKETSENDIWDYYELETVSVTVKTDFECDAKCTITNDPHIITYDGRHYDDHTDGIKTVYWNPTLNTEVCIHGVQIRTKSCFGGFERCPCGVAARAGLDVYVWDVCDDTVVLGYQYCDGDGRTLTVKVKDDNDIKIYFSYGTYVQVKAWRLGQKFLKAYVYPTAKDRDGVRGMCGTFDGNKNNDFHYRNGNTMSSDFHVNYSSSFWSRPTDFTDEWKVLPEDDLFNLTTFNNSSLERYEKTICVCENASSNEAGTDNLQDIIPCTPNGAAKCKQGRLLEATHCYHIETSKRRRRSVTVEKFRPRPRVPRVRIGNLFTNRYSRAKREVWTDVTSLERCNESFQATNIYGLCSQIESLNIDDNVEVCSIDIQLTNTTDWVSASINSLATECHETLLRNVTLVREVAKGDNPLLTNISQAYCTDLDCSNRGTCENGQCVCDEGYAGADCSVDLTMPPSMAGLLDGGLCDKRVSDCSETFIFGGQYVQSDRLKVKIEEFDLAISGIRTYTNSSIVIPSFHTYIELKVILESRRRRRSTTTSDDVFISGYTISVANDGQQYSETADFFMYDSDCQQVQNMNGTFNFSLRTGYCFIDSQCVTDGHINTVDSCYVCDERSTTREWSLNSSKTGCKTTDQPGGGGTEEDTVDTGDIVGAVVGSAAGLVLIVVLVLRALNSRNRKLCKKNDNAENNYDSLQGVFRSTGSMYADVIQENRSEKTDHVYVNTQI